MEKNMKIEIKEECLDIEEEELKNDRLVDQILPSKQSQTLIYSHQFLPLSTVIKKEKLEQDFESDHGRTFDPPLAFKRGRSKTLCSNLKRKNSCLLWKELKISLDVAEDLRVNLRIQVKDLLLKEEELEFQSEEEEFFAKLVTSKYPLVVLKSLSHEEIKKYLEVKERRESSNFGQEIEKESSNLKDPLTSDDLDCNKTSESNIIFLQDCKKFKCFKCSYVSIRKSNVKRHMFKHSDTKQFKCFHCEYETNHKGTLNKHLLTHSNSKPFKCFHCEYKSNHKSSLKIHLLNHSNTKLYKCSHCSYGSNRK
ncbi:RE1-silencing transcription factor [Armadillidium vulgare]|nr:RE1-silencing transcription factor [Armadillidium vulgare]